MKFYILCFFAFSLLFSEETKPSYLYPTHRQSEAGLQYRSKDFNYLLGKMKGFSDELLKMHFKLYEGYVKNTNSLIEMLQEMEATGKDTTLSYGALKRRLSWEYDGMVLHDYYFSNLGGHKPLNNKSLLSEQLNKSFGSFEKFKSIFKANGLIRGIGWVVLARGKDQRLFVNWIDEHNIGELAGATPLLVMDVWEHAYITEYGLNRAAYIDAFFDNVNWDVVSQRFSSNSAEGEYPKPS